MIRRDWMLAGAAVEAGSERLRAWFQALGTVVSVLLLVSSLAVVQAPARAGAEEPRDDTPGSIAFVGRNRIATANGVFHAWRFTRLDVDFDRLAESVVEVEIDVTSLDTGIKRRDDHLRNEDFFEVETWPTARIRVFEARAAGENDAGQPLYKASFEVQMHGVTRVEDGEFVVLGTSPPEVSGRLVLNRMDYGIGKAWSRWNPASVREEIPIEFEVQLKP